MAIGKRTGFICLFLFSLVACSQPNITIDKQNDVIIKGTGTSNLDKVKL